LQQNKYCGKSGKIFYAQSKERVFQRTDFLKIAHAQEWRFSVPDFTQLID
jgi:hypothetical protein